jgi:hypothetical protein
LGEFLPVVQSGSIRVQNLKFVCLKMAKIQGSDALMEKRVIAILNIDSILNNGPDEVLKRLFQQVQNGFIC